MKLREHLEEAPEQARDATSTNTGGETAKTLYQLGNLQQSEGRFKEAIESYTRALDLNPYFEDAVHRLRIAVEGETRLDEAVRNYHTASVLNPNPALAHLYFGHILRLQNKPDEAIQRYESALALNPELADAYYALGEVLARSSRCEEAIRQFSRAIQCQPGLSLAYSQIAHCLALLGDHAGAAKYDKQALAITSTPPLNVCPTPDDIKSNDAYRSWLKPAAIDTKSEHLPIIVFYRELHLDHAASQSLVYCLAQARRSNPRSDVIFLSDATHSYEFVHHDYIINYFKTAEEFACIYKHVAKDVRFDFILFCFQRWFVLLEFMSALGLDSCVHIDPDVMLYTDVTTWSQDGEYCDFRLSAHPDFAVCGHYNFIGSRAALEKYCDYVLDIYSNPPKKQSAASRMRQTVWEERTSYITDMDAFAEVRDAGICSFEDLSMVVDGSVWDANINSPDGFEFARGMKNICWIGEQPYCKAQDTKVPVRFHALHFNGKAKKYMRNAFLKRPLWLEE